MTDGGDKEKKLEIVDLKLVNRGVTKISGLMDMKNLKKLDIRKNQITNLENLYCDNLEELYVGENKLKTLEGVNDVGKTLRVFQAEKNEISKISGLSRCINSRFSMIKLEVLNLADNNIEKMEGLDKLVNLRVLNLSGNKIKILEGIGSLKNLESLVLSRNWLHDIISLCGSTENLSNLKNISLEMNFLTSPMTLQLLKNLERIDLSYNKITTLDGLFGWKKLKTLDLVGNYLNEESIEKIFSFYRSQLVMFNRPCSDVKHRKEIEDLEKKWESFQKNSERDFKKQLKIEKKKAKKLKKKNQKKRKLWKKCWKKFKTEVGNLKKELNESKEKLKQQESHIDALDSGLKNEKSKNNELTEEKNQKQREIAVLSFERSLMGRSFDSFEIVRKLGSGGYSVVCEVIYQRKRLGLKIVFNHKTPNAKNSSYRIHRRLIEGEFLHKLPIHKNLLRVHYCFVGTYDRKVLEEKGIELAFDFFHDKTAFFVTSLCNGTLKDIIERNGKETRPVFDDDGKFLLFLRDAVAGLCVLKEKFLIHCDIKPDNLFYMRNTFMIGDFGKCNDFSIEKQPNKFEMIYNHNMGVHGGAANYMPKEVSKKHEHLAILQYDKYDVYSLGIVCWNLFTTREGSEGSKLLVKECKDQQIRSLIESMLEKYSERISLEDLKERVEILIKEMEEEEESEAEEESEEDESESESEGETSDEDVEETV